MFDTFVNWLDRAGPLVFWTCAIALATIDGAAIAAVIGTKSRTLVNRWALPVVLANALLIGTGVGVPAAMFVTKVAVRAVAPSVAPSVVFSVSGSETAAAAEDSGTPLAP